MNLDTKSDKMLTSKEYTILVVDDNPQNLKVIDSYLREQGFNTLIASRGELALKRIQYAHPDLILLDVMLPGIDGFETCRQLKADECTKDIPVIFMTALTETAHKIKGFNVGGVDYVTKPFQYEEILLRITTHLHIRDLTQNLQQHTTVLSKRANQLEISNQVAQQINSILDPEELLTTVVTSIQSWFSYYFVSIWLLDGQKDKITLQTSSGGEGTAQLMQGFALEMNTANSIVVTACQTGQYYLIDDIHADHRYLTLKELPETRSELVIPLKLGQEVRGVLDIHHNRVAAFDREDITVLQALANQIGVALRNARLYCQLEQANTKLEEMSITDPLTGMKNRRYLSMFIHDDISKVQRDFRDRNRVIEYRNHYLNIYIGFLLMDIDHFKLVNDTYGHDAGDRVLQQIGNILQQCCRQTDILIRWGGEEILIESRYSNRHSTYLIAERIIKTIREYPFDIGNGQTIHLTCSIGFASYPFLPVHPECLNWEQVISIADQCLYMAKMLGRNAWVGFVSTEATSSHKLFQRIQHDVESLVRSGELTILTSLSE